MTAFVINFNDKSMHSLSAKPFIHQHFRHKYVFLRHKYVYRTYVVKTTLFLYINRSNKIVRQL